jgi:uncharacterized protein (DUF1499 family)
MYIALIILAVIAMVMVVPMVVGNNSAPSLGVNDGKLSPMPKKPNAVSSQTEDQEKYVEPFPFKSDLETTKKAILESIKKYGGYEVVKDEPTYLRVMFTTGKMKYHDDAEFYFDEAQKVVHFRSSSRIGYSDMGLNRERYSKLFDDYTSN